MLPDRHGKAITMPEKMSGNKLANQVVLTGGTPRRRFQIYAPREHDIHQRSCRFVVFENDTKIWDHLVYGQSDLNAFECAVIGLRGFFSDDDELQFDGMHD